MKWADPIRWPSYGTTRTKRRFLLFPKTINEECRWLEWATWTEYHRYPTELCENGWWEVKEWVNENPSTPTNADLAHTGGQPEDE